MTADSPTSDPDCAHPGRSRSDRAPAARARRPGRWAAALGAALLVAGTAAGCGGSGDDGGSATPETTSTTVVKATADDLGPLADALVLNHEAGGADFTVQVPYGVASFDMEGEISWTEGRGRAHVIGAVGPTGPSGAGASGAGGPTTFEVRFGGDSMAREEPDLAAVIGVPGARWLAHRVDRTTAGPLDRVLLLVSSLATTTRENTSLLAQSGVDLLAPMEVATPAGPVQAKGFRRGDMTYWVGESGNLVRVDAGMAATRSTVTVTLGGFGAKNPPEPEPPVIDEAKLSDQQRAALGGPG